MAEFQIIPFDKAAGSYFYTRDSFDAAKLNNIETPTGQNPDDFDILNNLMPVWRGSLEQRWGYRLYLTPSNLDATRRLYEYQSDSTGNRRLLICGTLGGVPVIQAATETPSDLVRVYTTSATANIPRLVVSRDYIYATAGVDGTQIKWTDTTVADAATKWGIDAPGVNVTSAAFPGTGADGTS
jgi:hypothetical protein